MSDPFANFLGARGTGVAEAKTVSRHAIQRQAAVAAYRQNIALPDVTIVGRRVKSTVPKIYDETGAELTPERWEELLKGKPKLIDVVDANGELLPGVDFRTMHEDIPTERLGASAERCLHPIRVVKPVEFDVSLVLADLTKEEEDQARIKRAMDYIYKDTSNEG